MKKTKRRAAVKKRQRKTPITGRRLIALTALVAGETRKAAAAEAKISTRTLDRWTADPEFRRELEDSQKGTFADALAALKAEASRAVKTLTGLLRSGNETVRRQAATEILNFAMKSHEAGEIETRLRALEKAAAEISDKAGARLVN